MAETSSDVTRARSAHGPSTNRQVVYPETSTASWIVPVLVFLIFMVPSAASWA